MQLKAWPAILAIAPICIQAAAVVDQAQNMTVRGRTDLSQDVANTFLSCLNATEVQYRLYVDEGITVVRPVVNRTIDFDGTDERLRGCMMLTTRNMSIAAEDATSSGEGGNGIHASRATFPWLVSQGAQGLHAIGTMKPGSPVQLDSSLVSRDVSEMKASLLEGRSFSHYWAFLSDYKSCASESFSVKYAGECHTYAQAYKSVMFGNPSGIWYLEVLIWPHHRCTNGQTRKIMVYPMDYSECHTKDTYSFHGIFTSKSSALSWFTGSS